MEQSCTVVQFTVINRGDINEASQGGKAHGITSHKMIILKVNPMPE